MAIWQSYNTEHRRGSDSSYMALVDAGAILAGLCGEVVDLLEAEARRVSKIAAAMAVQMGVLAGMAVSLSEDCSSMWWSEEQVAQAMLMNDAVCNGSTPTAVTTTGSSLVFAYVLAIETLRSLLICPYLVHRR